MRGKTTKRPLTHATIAKLENEIDAAKGLAALADTEGTVSLEDYLQAREGREIHKSL